MPIKIDTITETITTTIVDPIISSLVGQVTLVNSVRTSFKNFVSFCTFNLYSAGQEGLEPPTTGFGDRDSPS